MQPNLQDQRVAFVRSHFQTRAAVKQPRLHGARATGGKKRKRDGPEKEAVRILRTGSDGRSSMQSRSTMQQKEGMYDMRGTGLREKHDEVHPKRPQRNCGSTHHKVRRTIHLPRRRTQLERRGGDDVQMSGKRK